MLIDISTPLLYYCLRSSVGLEYHATNVRAGSSNLSGDAKFVLVYWGIV